MKALFIYQSNLANVVRLIMLNFAWLISNASIGRQKQPTLEIARNLQVHKSDLTWTEYRPNKLFFRKLGKCEGASEVGGISQDHMRRDYIT